jgi:hypothetical protein
MTILIDSLRAAELVAVGQENNPFVTGEMASATATTSGGGTQTLPAANALSGTTFDPWAHSIGSTNVSFNMDFGSAIEPTFCGIAAHNLGTLEGTVSLNYSDDGSSYTSVGISNHSPDDNQAIGLRFSAGSHRHWRLAFTDLQSTDVLSVGVIWLGNEIILPRRFYRGYRPPLTPTAVDLRTNVSEGAHLLGAAFQERGSTFSAEVSNLSDTFFRGPDWLAWQRHWNRGCASFWGWRPDKYGDLFYAWRSSNAAVVAPTNAGPRDLMSVTIEGRLYHE